MLSNIVSQRFDQVGNVEPPPGNEINNQEDGQVQTNFQEEHVEVVVTILELNTISVKNGIAIIFITTYLTRSKSRLIIH